MDELLIDATLKKAKDFFKNEATGHDFWHSLRVYNNAKLIAKNEVCDEELVYLAAILHDFDDPKITNSTKKLENATRWLEENNYSEDKIETIREIINSVSYKGTDTKVPRTIEGKIVQDADRLDAMGAMGISRTFAYGGNKGRPIWNPDEKWIDNMNEKEYRKNKGSSINHFYEKLLKLKDMLNTKSAKKIAENRHSYMENFLKEFFDEWGGKR